jgi:hypothetical protein
MTAAAQGRASRFAQRQMHGVVQADEPALRHHPVELGRAQRCGQLFQHLRLLGDFHRFGAETQQAFAGRAGGAQQAGGVRDVAMGNGQ